THTTPSTSRLVLPTCRDRTRARCYGRFFFRCDRARRDLHSFPTRRSSDLGNSTMTNSPTPVAVAGGLTFAAVSAGLYQTCGVTRSEEHTSELQSRENLVCRLLLEKKKRYLMINNILIDASYFTQTRRLVLR